MSRQSHFFQYFADTYFDTVTQEAIKYKQGTHVLSQHLDVIINDLVDLHAPRVYTQIPTYQTDSDNGHKAHYIRLTAIMAAKPNISD